MQINVTQKHIDEGDVLGGHDHPIALAMKDAGLSVPLVDGDQLLWWRGEEPMCWVMSDEIVQRKLDLYTDVCAPFSFELEVENQ